MNKEFKDFLDGKIDSFKLGDIDIIKVNVNERIAILYTEDYIQRHEFFKNLCYAGTYDKINGKIHEPSFQLKNDENILLNENDFGINFNDALKEVKTSINYYVEKNAENYIKDFKDLVLTTSKNIELNSFSKQNLTWDYIISNEDKYNNKNIGNELSYSFNSKDFINYITNKDEFIENITIKTLKDNADKIIDKIAFNEYARMFFKEIKIDVNNEANVRKAIISGINDNKCSTVNITINKDGKELTFKTDAKSLTGVYGPYASDILAKDREAFYNTFGKHSDYNFSDIKKVTYGKQVLFEKAPEKPKTLNDIIKNAKEMTLLNQKEPSKPSKDIEK